MNSKYTGAEVESILDTASTSKDAIEESVTFSVEDENGNSAIKIFGDGDIATKAFRSDRTPSILTMDKQLSEALSNSDLAIMDDKGNVLVCFLDGHIVTKNFDSRKV